MSSTTGLRTGDLLHEITRLRNLLTQHRTRTRALKHSRDHWRTRARAAEWALTQKGKP